MRKLLILSLFPLIIAGCKSKQTTKEKQKELQTGVLNEKNIYKADEIGWTIALPDWGVITKTENKRLVEKGKEAMEKTAGGEIDASDLVELINLKKDPYNNFLSTIQPFDTLKYGSYAGQTKKVYKLLKDTYTLKKINAAYIEDTAIIDGLKFDVFTAKIYNPDKTKVIVSQKMFSALINGYDFAMTMVYNNDADMKVLESAIYTSKFSKRN